MTIRKATQDLVAVGRRLDARGWVLGTSGNFSVVLERRPLRLLMTASSVHKGRLATGDLVVVDEKGAKASGSMGLTARGARLREATRPSAETLLHLQIVRQRGARAVIHTHSIWSTLLSERHHSEGGLAIEGYEMLKGLQGVTSHEHCAWLPILDNSQNMPSLADAASRALDANPGAHGFLIRRHGLYTWGDDLMQAERHVEIFEFLLEAVGRGAVQQGF